MKSDTGIFSHELFDLRSHESKRKASNDNQRSICSTLKDYYSKFSLSSAE